MFSRIGDGLTPLSDEGRSLGAVSLGLQLATSFQPVMRRVARHPSLHSPFRDEVGPEADLLVRHGRLGSAFRGLFRPGLAWSSRFSARRAASFQSAPGLGGGLRRLRFRNGRGSGFRRAVTITRFHTGHGGGALRRLYLFRFFWIFRHLLLLWVGQACTRRARGAQAENGTKEAPARSDPTERCGTLFLDGR